MSAHCIYIANFSLPHGLNAAPVYGLFYEHISHPLALNNLSQVLPIVFQSGKSKKKKILPALYAHTCSSVPDNGFLAEFWHSPVPRVLPGAFWDFVKEHNIQLSHIPSNPPSSSVPIGWGKVVAEVYQEPGFDPYPGNGYVQYVVVPYCGEVLRYLPRRSDEWFAESLDNIDFGCSYVCPDLLPALYCEFESPPSPSQFTDFLFRQLADTRAYAEQVARVALSVSAVAARLGEGTKRMVGAGILSLTPSRFVRFEYAYSSQLQSVEWKDLHIIVRSRVPQKPLLTPLVADLVKFAELQFYYNADYVVHTPNSRSYASVLVVSEFGIYPCVLILPSELIVKFPYCARIRLIRLVVNAQEARRLGVEAWGIEILEQYIPDSYWENPEETRAMLERIASSRIRPYTWRS